MKRNNCPWEPICINNIKIINCGQPLENCICDLKVASLILRSDWSWLNWPWSGQLSPPGWVEVLCVNDQKIQSVGQQRQQSLKNVYKEGREKKESDPKYRSDIIERSMPPLYSANKDKAWGIQEWNTHLELDWLRAELPKVCVSHFCSYSLLHSSLGHKHPKWTNSTRNLTQYIFQTF